MPGPAPVRAGLRDPRGGAWSRRRRAAGKTTLLQEIARAIERNHPEASTFDVSPVRHVQVAEIVIAKARSMAESRRNVLVLRDSITRLARALQHVLPPPGKALPGGRDRARMDTEVFTRLAAWPRRAMPGFTGRAPARSCCSCPRACWARTRDPGAALASVSARRGRSLERLRSGMIQTESSEAFLAILRTPGRAAAIRQRAH